MSAPMSQSFSLTKKSLKYHVIGQFCISLVLLILFLYPLYTNTSIDIVSNPLTASKCYVFTIIIFHAIFRICIFKLKGLKLQSKQIGKIIHDIFRSFLYCCLSVLLIHFVAILFGAAFTEYTAETFHFALVLSTTSVVTAFIHLGPQLDAWIRVFALNSPELGTESMVHMSSICSIVGAWMGAFPIPLDWDRPWQVWPITCVVGALIGHCVGLLISAINLCVQHYSLHKTKFT